MLHRKFSNKHMYAKNTKTKIKGNVKDIQNPRISKSNTKYAGSYHNFCCRLATTSFSLCSLRYELNKHISGGMKTHWQTWRGVERHLYHQSPPAITPILVSTQPIPEGSKDADLMPSRHQLWHTCQIIHATNSQDDFWKRTFLCLCGYENCMTMPHVNMLTHENESYIRSNKTY